MKTEIVYNTSTHSLVREVIEDFLVFYGNLLECDCNFILNEIEPVREAYVATLTMDWDRCRFSLELFFKNATAETMRQLDPCSWNFRHVLRWRLMLEETQLCGKPKGSPARIFYEMIKEAYQCCDLN